MKYSKINRGDYVLVSQATKHKGVGKVEHIKRSDIDARDLVAYVRFKNGSAAYFNVLRLKQVPAVQTEQL